MLNTELLQLLSKQELINTGHKATIYEGVLYSDSIYSVTGNAGRWHMNTFVRSKTTGRREIYLHVQWLICLLEQGHVITCEEHELFEENIRKLLLSITNLMVIYPKRQHVPDTDDPYRVLEHSMVRLLGVSSYLSDHIVYTNEIAV